MEFKSFIVFDQQFGTLDISYKEDRKPTKKEELTGIEYNFESKRLQDLKQLKNSSGVGAQIHEISQKRAKLYEFIKCLCTAHECYPEEIIKDDLKEIVFHGPSPDELTITDFIFRQGFEITHVSDDYVRVKKTSESGFLSN